MDTECQKVETKTFVFISFKQTKHFKNYENPAKSRLLFAPASRLQSRRYKKITIRKSLL